ncbi:MAG: alpha/beta hydrolase [Deltaproteobacteria bacterium]|nr:MAG: alpha/beta hydrolase [Deltaproteobacteria bacterium]
MKTKIFIHGLESSSQGVKGKFFKQKFPDIIVPDFVGSLKQRMEKLKSVLDKKDRIIIVGSSYGGLMGTIFTMEYEDRVEKLILLAPAINYLSMALKELGIEEKKIQVPTWIYHGKRDEVIPLKEVKPVAEKIFTDLSFNIVDDDHYLHDTFFNIPWNSFLNE